MPGLALARRPTGQGTWPTCGQSWRNARGHQVDGDRVTVIRERNAAYHALCEARRHCDRRRHTAGAIPSTWADRLAELERVYNLALAACTNWRC